MEPTLELVRVGRHRPGGTPRLHQHVHPDYHELVVVLSGDYRLLQEDGTAEGQPGNVFYHPRGVTHTPVSPHERPVDLLYVAWRQDAPPTPPWPRVPIFDALEQHTGYDLYGKNETELREIAKKLDVEVESYWDTGKLIDEIFSEKVEPNLIQPIFITDYPIELSPLCLYKENRERQ